MKRTDREKKPYKVGVLSVVKHDYLPRAIAAHPRFSLSFVSDDISRPEWTHERNQKFADEFMKSCLDLGIPGRFPCKSKGKCKGNVEKE